MLGEISLSQVKRLFSLANSVVCVFDMKKTAQDFYLFSYFTCFHHLYSLACLGDAAFGGVTCGCDSNVSQLEGCST